MTVNLIFFEYFHFRYFYATKSFCFHIFITSNILYLPPFSCSLYIFPASHS
jgi:hypothetical protein